MGLLFMFFFLDRCCSHIVLLYMSWCFYRVSFVFFLLRFVRLCFLDYESAPTHTVFLLTCCTVLPEWDSFPLPRVYLYT